MHRKLWRCAKMHIWALTYFEEVGHITECCYFDAMNFFWSDYCSPKWELKVQHSGHMWVQCLPMGTKWQCMPMGMKVQHSRHMSAMRLKFPFSMFQRLNQHRSHGPIFILNFKFSRVSTIHFLHFTAEASSAENSFGANQIQSIWYWIDPKAKWGFYPVTKMFINAVWVDGTWHEALRCVDTNQ